MGYANYDLSLGFSDHVQEGHWVWANGEKVVYTNWSPNEPNNASGNQQFGQMYPGGLWDDDYDNVRLIIVEWGLYEMA